VRRHVGLGHLGVEQRLEHGDAVGGLFDEREYDALASVPFDLLRQSLVQHLHEPPASRYIRHPHSIRLFGAVSSMTRCEICVRLSRVS
jgi:hypothetical protein